MFRKVILLLDFLLSYSLIRSNTAAIDVELRLLDYEHCQVSVWDYTGCIYDVYDVCAIRRTTTLSYPAAYALRMI